MATRPHCDYVPHRRTQEKLDHVAVLHEVVKLQEHLAAQDELLQRLLRETAAS